MTAEKEKPNDDDFETIRINGCWRRHVWVTSVRDWWRLRPTLEKYHQLEVANNTLSLKKSILGVRFFGDWNWNLFQAIVYERTESTLENVGTLPVKIFDFWSKFEIVFAKSSNHKIQIFVFWLKMFCFCKIQTWKTKIRIRTESMFLINTKITFSKYSYHNN